LNTFIDATKFIERISGVLIEGLSLSSNVKQRAENQEEVWVHGNGFSLKFCSIPRYGSGLKKMFFNC